MCLMTDTKLSVHVRIEALSQRREKSELPPVSKLFWHTKHMEFGIIKNYLEGAVNGRRPTTKKMERKY